MHDEGYEKFLAAIGPTPGLLGLWAENAYHFHNGCQYLEELQNLYRLREWIIEDKLSPEIQLAYLRLVANCLKEIKGDLTYEIHVSLVYQVFPEALKEN